MKLPKNFGGRNVADMMAEAQSAMARAQNLEEELANETIEIDKAGVKAEFSGTGEIRSIKIDAGLVDPDDIEMLEDTIVAAVRDGFMKATEIREAKVKEIMPNVPGLDKLGF